MDIYFKRGKYCVRNPNGAVSKFKTEEEAKLYVTPQVTFVEKNMSVDIVDFDQELLEGDEEYIEE